MMILAGIAVSACVLLLTRLWWPLTVIAGVLIAVTAGYDLHNVRSRLGSVNNQYVTATVGWGLYATLAGGVLIAAGALLTQQELRKPLELRRSPLA